MLLLVRAVLGLLYFFVGSGALSARYVLHYFSFDRKECGWVWGGLWDTTGETSALRIEAGARAASTAVRRASHASPYLKVTAGTSNALYNSLLMFRCDAAQTQTMQCFQAREHSSKSFGIQHRCHEAPRSSTAGAHTTRTHLDTLPYRVVSAIFLYR